MGSVVGEKIAHAFEEAIQQRLPVVSVAASGGARVQEGMFSLMQMAKVAAAASLHDRQGLAFISVLTEPNIWGRHRGSAVSPGDILIAEPNAQIGFVRASCYRADHRNCAVEGLAPRRNTTQGRTDRSRDRPTGAQIGDCGSSIGHLKWHRALEKEEDALPPAPKRKRVPAWQKLGLARHSGRPTTRYYITQMTSRFLELHGDRWGGDDPAIVGGLGELNDDIVVIMGQERGGTPEEKAASHDGMAFSEGYRKSLRLMRLASKFRILIVALADCPDRASESHESEHRGIAHALARNLATMANLPTVIISAIIGEGGSGGAPRPPPLIRPQLENAIYPVISLEGAAAILYRDAKKAEAVSAELKLTAQDLYSLWNHRYCCARIHWLRAFQPAAAAWKF